MLRIKVLLLKCIRQISRQKSTRTMFIVATTIVFSSLYIMWYFSKGFSLHYLTSDSYNRMSFDLECVPKYDTKPEATKGDHKTKSPRKESISCKPSKDMGDQGVGNLTPTDILINVISTGNILGDRSNNAGDTHDFSVLLSNIMMNGFPLLGLDDFVAMSDFVNAKLGDQGRHSILDFNGYKDRFGNFLNVRTNQLRITGHKCIAEAFLRHLSRHSKALQGLNVQLYDSMSDAMNMPPEKHAQLWAVLDLQSSGGGDKSGDTAKWSRSACRDFLQLSTAESDEWSLTVRMHPSAIPDTRNFKWSPLKSGISRMQSGQLLYFISGFLTLQLELQNFLAFSGKGGPAIKTQVFKDETFLQPNEATQNLANAIMLSRSRHDIRGTISNASSYSRPPLRVPLYHRAFPTHFYTQQTYWHSFGSMIASILIIFFCLPAAITSGAFLREVEDGQQDQLSTLPGVRATDNAQAWMLCGSVLCVSFFACCWGFFALVLRHSYSIIPSTCLLLCGVSLCAAAMIMGIFVRRADTLVVAVPTFAFVSLLPGLLYCDLAFDVQRTWWVEALLCLLPPSGAALIIREVCSNEALKIAVTWSFTSSISHMPIYAYTTVLLLDIPLYYGAAVVGIHFLHDHKAHDGSSIVVGLIAWHERVTALSFMAVQSVRRLVLRMLGQTQHYMIISEEMDIELSSDPFQAHDSTRSRELSRSNSHGRSLDALDSLAGRGAAEEHEEHATMLISGLSASYNSGGVDVEILSNVTADLKKGRVTLLLGSNGAGKTTMMRILCGLNRNHGGSVKLSIEEGPASTRNIQRQIGWCPQDDALYDCLTVREHMQMFAALLSHESKDTATFTSSSSIDSLQLVYIPPIAGHLSAASNASSMQDADINAMLENLGLTEHAEKVASQLSGGMRRRLSLALALAGMPRVLLLDEPSSGCDSWTRELIRQCILSRKQQSAVLVSTHHIDDVEVIADQLWFLNDRYLVFDGPIDDLIRSRRHLNEHKNGDSGEKLQSILSMQRVKRGQDHHPPRSSGSLTTDAYLELSSWDPRVKSEFTEHFAAIDAELQMGYRDGAAEDGGNARLSSWKIPSEHTAQLKTFLSGLESRGILGWSLSSPSVYSSLVGLYAPPGLTEDRLTENTAKQQDLFIAQQSEPKQPPTNWIRSCMAQIGAVAQMRLSHTISQLSPFLATQIFIPFIIVLAVTIGCTDVSYPKTELSSAVIEGVGEVLVGVGRADFAAGSHGALRPLKSHIPLPKYDPPEQSSECYNAMIGHSAAAKGPPDARLQFDGYERLAALLDTDPSPTTTDHAARERTLCWQGPVSSDQLFQELYQQYYSHRLARWGAFVVHDDIAKWIESAVRIPQTALEMDINDVFEELATAGAASCVNATLEIYSNSSEEKSFVGAVLARSEESLVISTATFCDANRPAMRISLERGPAARNDSTHITIGRADEARASSSQLSLVIHSYQPLLANVSMLSNVTTDHAAPVFLKEIAPRVYASLQSDRSQPASDNPAHSPLSHAAQSKLQLDSTPQYRLYSHPLPEVNLTNQVYIERGYLGATMIVMYMLITTIMSVRFVAQCRKNGVKTQLHLSGLSPLCYWVANFLVDAGVVFLPLVSVGIAVTIGGPPIRDYFIMFLPFPFCLYLVSITAYSFAVVASSYCLCVLSTDQLASQLTMLISALTCGVFLKLYLDRHNSEPFLTISSIFQVISPAYAFTTCMFDMFKAHAVEVSVASGIASTRRQAEECVQKVLRGALGMLLQAVVYLSLTATIDSHYSKFIAWSARMRIAVYLQWDLLTAATPCKKDGESSGLSGQSDHLESYATRTESANSSGVIGALSSLPNVDMYPISNSAITRSTSRASMGSGNISRTSSCRSFDKSDTSQTVQRRVPAVDLVVADGVCVEYPGKATLGLCDFSCTIAPSERIALMGMNGGGKSTLFKALALAENVPIAGSLQLSGMDSVSEQWSFGPTGVVGYVPQEGGLLAFLSVQQTIELFEALRGSAAVASSAHGVSASSGNLTETLPQASMGVVPSRYRHYPVHTLSGGNKKKLLVHVANIGTPRLLLLDECTTGIDPVSAEQLVNHLSLLDPTQGLLFASHRIDECVRVCTRALMLYKGQKHFDGSIGAFDKLTSIFYQVDVSRRPSGHNSDTRAFLDVLTQTLGGVQNIERVVEYSPSLFRITLEKRAVPLTALWVAVLSLQARGILDKFSFRLMGCEEAISSMISEEQRTN